MKLKCCYCASPKKVKTGSRILYRIGRFWRKSDGHWVQRFWCLRCKKSFSAATSNEAYRQKKRHKNWAVRKLLCGGVSQREAARILRINRKTVVRKFLFVAKQVGIEFEAHNKKFPPAKEVEFDDLETFEHTKCKPLSVTIMVEFKTRRLLGLEVSQMPAKGKLAEISRRKYGRRKDERGPARKRLFQKVKDLVHPEAVIRSDSNPLYPQDVKTYFPKATHQTIMGGRGCSTGQGELKKLKFDPIFSLNHTCAMLRANINRLFRKTWCTTKKPDRLAMHLALYAMSHNQRLSTAKGAS